MKITTDHLAFYRACKTPTPSWISLIKKPRFYTSSPTRPDTINSLINCQDESLSKHIRDRYLVSNFLTILRQVRDSSRSPRSIYLFLLNNFIEDEFSTPKNRAMAIRWCKRIKSDLSATAFNYAEWYDKQRRAQQ